MSNLEKFNVRQSFSNEMERQSELLAPVANDEMLQAAIHNGADAVYIGMPGHNARARSEDLTFSKLKDMIFMAHQLNVRVFIAFNILIFEEEILNLEHELVECLSLKPDAIIVQDIGLCRLIKKIAPEQVIHASTQMTHTNARGINFLNDLDLKRFVLGREVSLDEMTLIRSNTTKELEVFVHGALCVAYSGQCLTSESFGGRSANRGQCAQSCREEYKLIVDQKVKPLPGIHHFVSPKDLCGLDDIPKLIDIGIDSFKIEGRYKSAEYVGLTSKSYRNKMDYHQSTHSQDDLEIMFSRGFHSGWLHGVHHDKLVSGKNSSHRGAYVGEIAKVDLSKRPFLIIKSDTPIYKGDGLHICDEHESPISSGKAYEVDLKEESLYQVEFSNHVELNSVKKGYKVYINSSDHRDQMIKQSWKDKKNHKKILIQGKVIASLSSPLELSVSVDNDRAKFFSESNLQVSLNKPISKVSIEKEMKKLGGSVYQFEELQIECEEGLFISAKELKQVRQKMIAWLDDRNSSSSHFKLKTSYQEALKTPPPQSIHFETPVLHVLIREPHQIDFLDPKIVQKVTLDYKHGVTYGPSIKRIRELGCEAGIATTRILKEGQERRLNDLKKHLPDYILVRNFGALQYLLESDDLKQIPRIADFSFNVTNHLSSNYILNKGTDLICPSYDLNKPQLFSLLSHCEPSRYEITIHQYMPSFHMEHCVFATFLSKGTNSKNCGLVCREHEVALKDKNGIEHPLQADQECRNTMFNGKAQSAASLIPDLLNIGVRNFRIEALTESSKEIADKLKQYRDVIDQIKTPELIKSTLGLDEKYGISEGQLLNNRVYQDRKKSRVNN